MPGGEPKTIKSDGDEFERAPRVASGGIHRARRKMRPKPAARGILTI